MFEYLEKVLSKNTFQFQIKQQNKLLSFREVMHLWQESAAFRLFYNQLLTEIPFLSFYWENKPITSSSLDNPYEFVIVSTNIFHGKQANPNSFQTYFSTESSIVHFPNLGKNATLIVPCPIGNPETYTHLGTFIRNAPAQQINLFWQRIGLLLEQAINEQPLWLSTSGLGVHWLHVRLDQRPKYYKYIPYRSF